MTKEINWTTAMKLEHIQCIKQAIESLDDYKKGSFYCVYFDERRYNVSYGKANKCKLRITMSILNK